jgi:hypothetical protein
MWVCSAGGRGDIAWEKGHEFESRWPRSREKCPRLRRRQADADQWAPPPINFFFRFFRIFFISRFVERRALSKEAFADRIFAEGALPRAALGKGFAESLRGFGKSLRPSAKQPTLWTELADLAQRTQAAACSLSTTCGHHHHNFFLRKVIKFRMCVYIELLPGSWLQNNLFCSHFELP